MEKKLENKLLKRMATHGRVQGMKVKKIVFNVSGDYELTFFDCHVDIYKGPLFLNVLISDFDTEGNTTWLRSSDIKYVVTDNPGAIDDAKHEEADEVVYKRADVERILLSMFNLNKEAYQHAYQYGLSNDFSGYQRFFRYTASEYTKLANKRLGMDIWWLLQGKDKL